jgi:hypothetical protein
MKHGKNQWISATLTQAAYLVKRATILSSNTRNAERKISVPGLPTQRFFFLFTLEKAETSASTWTTRICSTPIIAIIRPTIHSTITKTTPQYHQYNSRQQ